MGRDGSWFPACRSMLALALVVNLFLAGRSYFVERHLRADVRSHDSLKLASVLAENTWRAERASLVKALGELPVSAPFLAGRTALDSSLVTIGTAMDGVYYLLSPRCPACSLNLPFLDSLERVGGLKVVAFSRDGAVQELREYLRAHGTRLELLATPTGHLEAIAPRFVTPTSLVVIEGRLRAIINGRIGDRQKEELLGLAQGRSSVARP